jgi:hypothetical protein
MALGMVLMLWVCAALLASPEAFTLTTVQPHMVLDTVLFTQCEAQWSDQAEAVYVIAKAVMIFLLPIVFMIVCYAKLLARYQFQARHSDLL